MKGTSLPTRVLGTSGVPLLIVLVALVVIFQILNPVFLDGNTVQNYLRNGIPILLLTLGVSIVIIGGGIDLSVGAVVGLSAGMTMYVLVEGAPLWLGVMTGVGTGLAFGLVNGFVVAYLNMNDFIATLATLNIGAGLLVVLSQARLLQGVTTPGFPDLARGTTLGIPTPFLITGIIFVLVQLLLAKSVFGRRVYALGVSAQAASVAGVDVRRVRMATFALSGLLAGVAGVLFASRMGAVQAFLGTGFEFIAIAGAVIGGVSLAGGRGTAWAALVGGLFLATLQQGLRLNNVDPVYFSVLTALCVVLGVVFDRQVHRFVARMGLSKTAAAHAIPRTVAHGRSELGEPSGKGA